MTVIGDTKDVRLAMQACVDHARNLLESAKLVLSTGRANIAFHLGVLTLEEIGRRELIAVTSVSREPERQLKLTQDHLHKLFWSMFGAIFGVERLSNELLENLKGFARKTHEKRLSGLYVGVADGALSIPTEHVSTQEAEQLLRLAEARLDQAGRSELRMDLSDDERDLRNWFLSSSENPEIRALVFSSRSMDELSRLGDPHAWMRWIRGTVQTAEQEGRDLALAELERSRRRAGAPATQDKWRLRLKLYSASHSIRQKALNHWNERVSWIRLHAVQGKKNELVVEITLKDDLPIEELWAAGLSIGRRFLTALNLASGGYWFWRLPTQVGRYYETLEDLESKAAIRLERTPSLAVAWGSSQVLTPDAMDTLVTAFVLIPPDRSAPETAAFDFYNGGLTFLSLNDVHYQCEATVVGNFLSSLREMMRIVSPLAVAGTFPSQLAEFVRELAPDGDETLDKLVELAHALESNALQKATVTLLHASFARALCDGYFLGRLRPLLIERKRGKAQPGDADDPEPNALAGVDPS